MTVVDRISRPAGPTGIRWRILALVFASSFVAYLLRTNMSVAGERMIGDLGLTQVQLGLVLAAFAWGNAAFQFPGGLWGERVGAPVLARETGADAAGLAFDGLQQARAAGIDVLLIDTAGRLHNKADLMAELQKIIRVLRKVDPAVPHHVLLVLDATTGQNAHAQVDIFRQMTAVTGLVVTKLDGTARGGVLVALAERFHLPIHAIGVGESADDLRPFAAAAFARSLMGLAE